MPEIRPPVDLETVLVGALEQDADLAPLVGGLGDAARISTRLPSSFGKGDARVKITRPPGGAPVGWPDHLDRAIIQGEAYGPDDAGAFSIVAALLVAMARLEATIVAGGVITGIDRISGPGWLPDPDADNAARYVVQWAVYAHPTA
jgi:hypothetical protein